MNVTIIGAGNMGRGIGMRPSHAGLLSSARQIETMQFLHITLQGTLGSSWMSTIKIIS